MEYFIGCDSHKKYSVFVIVDERGAASKPVRVEHDRSLMRQFLNQLPVGSRIALEAGGHYYWLVDEMEKAGHLPHLTHPLEAKKRMGKTAKKTDGVDSRGLAILLRNGTLPTVWIPPAELRDQRELLRLRMFFGGQQTRLKNRIHGTLARYNLGLALRTFTASTEEGNCRPVWAGCLPTPRKASNCNWPRWTSSPCRSRKSKGGWRPSPN